MKWRNTVTERRQRRSKIHTQSGEKGLCCVRLHDRFSCPFFCRTFCHMQINANFLLFNYFYILFFFYTLFCLKRSVMHFLLVHFTIFNFLFAFFMSVVIFVFFNCLRILHMYVLHWYNFSPTFLGILRVVVTLQNGCHQIPGQTGKNTCYAKYAWCSSVIVPKILWCMQQHNIALSELGSSGSWNFWHIRESWCMCC